MNLLQEINNDKILNTINANFDNDIYLVGGAVRDILMNKKTYDRDLIVCDINASEFSEKLAKILDATFITLDEENKIYRLVLNDKLNYLDITEPIEHSLEKDLKRRDLTINSIAINIKSGEVIDINNGINDLNNKIINMISTENMYDDPLRMLRAYRFQAALGFDVSKDIKDFTEANYKLINKSAKERITYELMKIFDGYFTDKSLSEMGNLLEEILPVIKEVKQVPPNTHHHLDLFNHSIETVKQIQYIYNNSSNSVKEHLNRVDFGGFSRLSHLKFAGFLHDIGKFSTWKVIEGRHRFIKHDDVGAKMSVKILKNMNFSNKQIDYISLMIKNHIYPSSVMSAPEVNDKVMMRFVRKMDLNSIDVIILAMADRLSARGPEITEEMVDNNIRNLSHLLDFYLEKRESLEPLPVLLDGNEVMNILKIKPSKQLGNIMNELHEAQMSGDILTKSQAIDFIKKLNV